MLLEVKNLKIGFSGIHNEFQAVNGISFDIKKGEIFAVVGESGSGKSLTALSIMQLLNNIHNCKISGSIKLDKEELIGKKESELCKIRGKKISMIFQEPMTSLNPLHTIGKQIAESITLHERISGTKLQARVKELMQDVELEALANRLDAYPHELSGGQRQRVMIAMAIANNPELLIADEPTTALDVTVQLKILELLKKLQKKNKMAVLFITHDLGIVKHMATRVAVMKNGKIEEMGPVSQVFKTPKKPYTKKLIKSAPHGHAVSSSEKNPVVMKSSNLTVDFPLKKSFFGKVLKSLKAVDGIDLQLKKGHTLGIVGESGSGKSTLAYALTKLVRSSGEITFRSMQINSFPAKSMRKLRKEIQIVFQDPYSSLNPRLTVAELIGEGLLAHNIGKDRSERDSLAARALSDVGLNSAMLNRYPHEFSGGQRQRVAIARSLALNPQLIILDEPTSALDLSSQYEILELLKKLQQDKGLSYIFISHDLRVIKAISHEIIVMKDGKIMERGATADVFASPKSSYTKSLLEASFAFAA